VLIAALSRTRENEKKGNLGTLSILWHPVPPAPSSRWQGLGKLGIWRRLQGDGLTIWERGFMGERRTGFGSHPPS
jgi:hypothetical protein